MIEAIKTQNKFFVSIIVPVYNEEKAIGRVIDDINREIRKGDYLYEIIVVDDASSDRSAEIAKERKVRVIQRRINGGSGASRKTGIKNAAGEIIVMLDGDGSYDASSIPKMLSYFPEYDQVNGARISEEGTFKILRFSAKWLIRKLACYLTGTKIPDLNTGLKSFKRDIMKKYLWMIPDGFSCVTSMTLAFLTNGHSVKYIPTKYFKRIGKSKFHPIKDTLSYLQTIIRMITFFSPLKIFLPVSLFLFFAGIFIFLFSYFFTPKVMDISTIILLVSSFQILAIGTLAELIVKTRNRQ